jgi:hypothetical protein
LTAVSGAAVGGGVSGVVAFRELQKMRIHYYIISVAILVRMEELPQQREEIKRNTSQRIPIDQLEI